MRVFEVKPSGLLTLDHVFILNSAILVAAGDVLLSIFPVVDESDFDQTFDQQPQWMVDRALVLREKAVYDATLNRYVYDLTTNEGWGLGVYMIQWEAAVGGREVTEFDKLNVVTATRQDIVDALEMPSSISAGGITIDYSARVADLRKERGLRVQKLSKRRRPGQESGDRDYDRGNKI
jgi:hypothetical protein